MGRVGAGVLVGISVGVLLVRVAVGELVQVGLRVLLGKALTVAAAIVATIS